MMIRKIILSLMFFLVAGLFIWSCIGSKKDLPEPDVDLSLEQDYMTILSDLNTLQTSVEAGYRGNTNGCGTYTFNSDTAGGQYGKFTIDFAGITCSDGITKNGTIEVYHTGSYSKRNLKDSVSYSVSFNGRNIYGYRLRSSIFSDSIPHIKSFIVNDVVFEELLSGRNYSLLSGMTRTDDSTGTGMTTMYGNSRGSGNGNEFSVAISATTAVTTTHINSFPLKFEWTCSNPFRYPVSGALSFTNITRNLVRLINFDQRINADFWKQAPCGRDTATYVSPKGNLYYFSLK